MKTTTIRIRSTSYEALKEIAESAGRSVQEMIDQAVGELLRRHYLEQANADYARLNSDRTALAEFNREISEWDITNCDGLLEPIQNLHRGARRGRRGNQNQKLNLRN